MTRKWLSLFVFVCCWLTLPTLAGATPWVLEEDEIAITGRFDYQRADREFFGPGEAVDYSLNGEYEATTFAFGARLGIVDRLEMKIAVPIKNVSYRADPVILLPCEEQTLDCSQENINDLSKTVSGVGDIRLGGRYQFLEGPLAGAFELMIKTPTGYDQPSGTFGAEPKSVEDFQENITTYATPDNIEDDVTLGDGQLDVGARALFGWSLPSRTFIRLDAGYLLRLAGGGDQVTSHLQLGQLIGQRLLLIGGASFDYAVQNGEVIGVSVAAQDPSLPAEDYEGTKNLRLREVPLDEDRLKVHGGVLLQMTEQTELKLNYSRVVWGRNTAMTQTLSIGFGVRFDLAEQTSGG
jgi:hypothetical protein